MKSEIKAVKDAETFRFARYLALPRGNQQNMKESPSVMKPLCWYESGRNYTGI